MTGSPDVARVGLCAACRHARIVRSKRSTFWLCERSRTDPRFPRYPNLPVLRCVGFEPHLGDATG
jgi:hypothetical protein